MTGDACTDLDQLDNWVGTRRIWNQHGYYITNVNEDGTIPRQEVPNWQVFNNFRQNEAIPDEGLSPYAASDLTAAWIRLDEANCPTSVTLTARIGNGGGDVAPAGVPVSFYDGDPASGGTLIEETIMDTTIAARESHNVFVSWIIPLAHPLPTTRIYVEIDPDNNFTNEVHLC